jgi:hypothetical protein
LEGFTKSISYVGCFFFIRCEAPIEMKGKLMYDLYKKNSQMRCLDMYGSRPERDASILIGMLIGRWITSNCQVCYHTNPPRYLFE